MKLPLSYHLLSMKFFRYNLFFFLIYFSSSFREELKEKYEDKLEKELSGPTYEVLGKIMKIIINRKLTGPGNFIG